jgi:hypothetical protein
LKDGTPVLAVIVEKVEPLPILNDRPGKRRFADLPRTGHEDKLPLQIFFDRGSEVAGNVLHEAILQFGQPNVYLCVCLPKPGTVACFAAALATKVIDGQSTSSPGPISSPFRARKSAAVPFETATASAVPVSSAKRRLTQHEPLA